MSNTPSPTSFEEAVSRLEDIVTALEAGNLPLDECLKRFETAVGLSRFCAGRLEAAEKQIRILTTDGSVQPATGLPWANEVPGVEPAGGAQPGTPTVIQSNFDWDS